MRYPSTPKYRCVVLVVLAFSGIFLPIMQAEEGVTVRGTIAEVRPNDNQFTLRTAEGDELLLQLRERATVRLKEREAKLADFQKGMRVVVVYDRVGGMNQAVILSDALVDKSPPARVADDPAKPGEVLKADGVIAVLPKELDYLVLKSKKGGEALKLHVTESNRQRLLGGTGEVKVRFQEGAEVKVAYVKEATGRLVLTSINPADPSKEPSEPMKPVAGGNTGGAVGGTAGTARSPIAFSETGLVIQGEINRVEVKDNYLCVTTDDGKQLVVSLDHRGQYMTGKISRVDNNAVVIAGSAGQEYSFPIDPQTRFLLNNKVARFADFQVGTQVGFTFDPTGRRLLSLNNPPLNFAPPQNRNAPNPNPGAPNPNPGVPNLNPGAPMPPAAEGKATISGKIAKIPVVANQPLVIAMANGQSYSFLVDAQTKMSIDGKPAQLGDFKVGMDVTVQFEKLSTGVLHALAVIHADVTINRNPN